MGNSPWGRLLTGWKVVSIPLLLVLASLFIILVTDPKVFHLGPDGLYYEKSEKEKAPEEGACSYLFTAAWLVACTDPLKSKEPVWVSVLARSTQISKPSRCARQQKA